MSNIIPMVSSSPPPMDEGGGFDWDDDDDFGTFASASDNSFSQTEVTASQDSPFKSTPVPNHIDQSTSENDFGGFANFESQIDDKSYDVSLNHGSNNQSDTRPECIHLPQKQKELEEPVSVSNESNGYQNTNGPLVDSGVYSSNVSPVQHVESSGSENVQVNNDECKITADQEERSQNVDSASQKHEASSVTQENVETTDESENIEQTQSSEEPIKCIPPKNIPENDHVTESGTEDENFTGHEKDNSNVVIFKCDESNCNNSETLQSKSSENENSNSVKSANSQEFENCQTVSQIENDMESTEARIEKDIPPEKNSDLEEISSVDQHRTSLEETNSDGQRPDTTSESVSDTAEIHSNESADEEGNDQENIEGSNSTVQEESLQNEKVSMPDTNSYQTNESPENIDTDATDENCIEVKDHGHHESVHSDQDETNVSDTHSLEKDNDKDVIKNTNISDSECPIVTDTSVDTKEGVSQNDKNLTECEKTFSSNLKPSDSSSFSETCHQYSVMPVNDTKETTLNESQDEGDTAAAETENVDNENFGDFSETKIDTVEDFGDFSASIEGKQGTESSSKDEEDGDDGFGAFDTGLDNVQEVWESADNKNEEDFGDFSASASENVNKELSGDDFGGFNATFDDVPTASEQTSNNWAAFSEPQIATGNADNEDDDWAGFEEDEPSQSEDVTSTDKTESEKVPVPDLSHMSKQEKLLFAVTTCFPALVSNLEIGDNERGDLGDLHVDSDSHVWGHVKGQDTTDALTYQWTKSLWNTQLFTTLHIDTRNILIGHKKTPVPVYAAGLTLLEPTKGQAPLKPEVLVDTSKSDPSLNSTSQIKTTSVQRPNKNESIPAAQFDWSTSGLTNPLEANNKTLNLDFLIQDQATKSNALESEFLSTNESPVHKPAIQPLENILANMKTSSTFKPTNQNEHISPEASKVVHSIPDLVFMKSKVLMFPVKLGFQD